MIIYRNKINTERVMSCPPHTAKQATQDFCFLFDRMTLFYILAVGAAHVDVMRSRALESETCEIIRGWILTCLLHNCTHSNQHTFEKLNRVCTLALCRTEMATHFCLTCCCCCLIAAFIIWLSFFILALMIIGTDWREMATTITTKKAKRSKCRQVWYRQ